MTVLLSAPVTALDDATFTQLFSAYDAPIEQYVNALEKNNSNEATEAAKALEKQSKHLMEAVLKDSNIYWEFDAANLWHHSEYLGP